MKVVLKLYRAGVVIELLGKDVDYVIGFKNHSLTKINLHHLLNILKRRRNAVNVYQRKVSYKQCKATPLRSLTTEWTKAEYYRFLYDAKEI